MAIDDDDDFEMNEEFSEEDMERAEKEMEEKERRTKKHPLYLQAKEVLNIVDVLYDLTKEGSMHQSHVATMRDSAMMVYVKVSSGLRMDDYVICMQNAAIIRDHAQYLRLSNHSLKAFKTFEKKYIDMFREEMEKFRKLFKIWAKEIHQMDQDVNDEWGLFVK